MSTTRRPPTANIVTAIEEMAQGRIDAIALTSSGQVRRLIEVARASGLRSAAARGTGANADRLGRTGRVRRTESHGLRADIYPANDAFFMKPLISAMAAALAKKPPRAR